MAAHAGQPRIIYVFIASPGDLKDERKAFNKVIDELNRGFGEGLGVKFVPLGWEDTLAEIVERSQDVINQDIDRSDVFVLVFNRWWGQPAPDVEAPATSYTEEEYLRALKRWKETKSPTIYIFFKNVDTNSLKDPGPQLQKVLAFRRKLEDTHTVICRQFTDEKDFAAVVDEHLRAYAKNTSSKPDASPEIALIEVKHIMDAADLDLVPAKKLYEKRIEDGVPWADIMRWINTDPEENVFLVAKSDAGIEGFVLFHCWAMDCQGFFLAYLVVRRHKGSPRPVSDVLMDEVFKRIDGDPRFKQCERILFEVDRPIPNHPRDTTHKKQVHESLSRIKVFHELAVRRRFLLRAIDIDYVQPSFSSVGNERPMLLMCVQRGTSTDGKMPASEVCGILRFIYTQLYPAEYSDDRDEQRQFEDYCKELLERKTQALSDPVNTLTPRQIMERFGSPRRCRLRSLRLAPQLV